MTCPQCGTRLAGEPPSCPKCVVKQPNTGAYGVTVYPIGTVVASPPDHPAGIRIDYKTASGGRSLSEMTASGDFTTEMSTPLDRGRSNEWHVRKMLKTALRGHGQRVNECPSARDAEGEDAIFEIDGQRTTVQIVMLPTASEHWKTLAASGASSSQVDLHAAVELVRQALVHKKDKATGALVALDAHYMATLAGRRVVHAYLATHGDPVAEFGFADVWIVGPTKAYTVRLRARPAT